MSFEHKPSSKKKLLLSLALLAIIIILTTIGLSVYFKYLESKKIKSENVSPYVLTDQDRVNLIYESSAPTSSPTMSSKTLKKFINLSSASSTNSQGISQDQKEAIIRAMSANQ